MNTKTPGDSRRRRRYPLAKLKHWTCDYFRAVRLRCSASQGTVRRLVSAAYEEEMGPSRVIRLWWRVTIWRLLDVEPRAAQEHRKRRHDGLAWMSQQEREAFIDQEIERTRRMIVRIEERLRRH